jgi:hypothetical protein
MLATAYNTVFVVRYAHPNVRLRSHFTNTEPVDQNAALLERLYGVRILVNGWRASERLQPKINRRYF